MTPPTPRTDRRADQAVRRRRTHRMRRGVAAGAVTLFVGVWSGLATQLAGSSTSTTAGRTATTAVVAKATTQATTTAPAAAAPTSVATSAS